jgi:acetyltransferase-like isoleucine patch superfamily enzyme
MPVNHEFRSSSSAILDQGFAESKGGIIIGDDVWIGSNCVILDGSYIGTGCVIGAGSVVNGNLANFGIYVGNPLKQIGTRNV